MRTLITLSLTCLIATQTVVASTQESNGFVCKELYEKKIKRLRFAEPTMVGTSAIGGGAVVASIFAAGMLPVAVVALPASLAIGIGMVIVANKKDGLEITLDLQRLMNYSEAQILEVAQEEARKFMEASLSSESNLLAVTRVLNRERDLQGLPRLTTQEAKAYLIADAIKKVKISNLITSTLEQAEATSVKVYDMKLSYDEWGQHINKNQDAFCPNGKPLQLERVLPELIERL